MPENDFLGSLPPIGTEYQTILCRNNLQVSPEHFGPPFENVGDIEKLKGPPRTERTPQDTVHIGHS